MRNIRHRALYKRDFKREFTGRHRKLLMPDGELERVENMLANDKTLPFKYRDHPLQGDLEGSRECHIRPNFLLVYRYEGDDWLILERLGSHSELFGL